ncbi:MAG: hypothetical protein K8R73_15140 [Clostridiales bacterium]|nr:hypothetical protein [Clostridiales bacterium]
MYLVLIINSLAVLFLLGKDHKFKKTLLITKRPLQVHHQSFIAHGAWIYKLIRRYSVQTFLEEWLGQGRLLKLWGCWAIIIMAGLYFINLPLGLKILFWIMAMCMPAVLLEWRLEWIDNNIDRTLFTFLSKANACLIQNEDLINALLEVERSITNVYIRKGLKVFNTAIRAGVSSEVAFKMLLDSTHHDYLRYIYLNLEQVHLRQGDVIELLKALENEYTAIQIELNKRKIELQHDRNLTLFSFVLVVLTAMRIIKTHDYIVTFYMSTALGQVLSFMLVLSMGIGLGIVIIASRKRV